MLVAYFVNTAGGFNAARKFRGEGMYPAGNLFKTTGAVVAAIHTGHNTQQHLRCADVGGGILALDMLFAGLQRHTQGTVTTAVNAHTDDATWHLALVFVFGGHVGGMGATITHGNTKTLGTTHHAIGAHFAGRGKHRE